MADQQTEKGTWNASLESARGPAASGSNEKPARTPNTLVQASSTAVRSVQHRFDKVWSGSVRLYRYSWPRVSSSSVRLYERSWPRISSTTVRLYQRGWPKVSSASVRVYQRTWPRVSARAARLCQNDLPRISSTAVRSLCSSRLEALSMALRLVQWLSALYIYVYVTESFRSKLTFDGRVRQIQPMMSIALLYTSLASVTLLLLNAIKRFRLSAWRVIVVSSVPADVSMVCLFIAEVVVFGVHSFECAAMADRANPLLHYNDLEYADTLRLLSNPDNRSHGGHAVLSAARDTCLFRPTVYVLCIVAATSLMGTVAVTIIQLLDYRKSMTAAASRRYPGHIEQAMPATVSWGSHMVQRRSTRPGSSQPGGPLPGATSSAEPPSSRGTLPPPAAPSSQDPKYANLPAGLVESMAAPRVSEETTLSMDPDNYIVSDGFRPPSRPPSYSSRESSPGPPEYRSRPPSLHTVVLVGP